jgi:hypothetical protein
MGKKYLDLALDLSLERRIKKLRRTGEIDLTLLGDFPYLPIALVRPLRKTLKIIGLYRRPSIGHL